MFDTPARKCNFRPIVRLTIKRRIDIDKVDLAAHRWRVFIACQQSGHCKKVVAIDETVHLRGIEVGVRIALRCQHVLPVAVLGRDDQLAGLQPDPIIALDPLQNLLRFTLTVGDDFRQLL